VTILITGATGFLGSRLARLLSERGEQVRVLVRPTSDLRRLADLSIERAEGDITDRASVADALDGCLAVHHVAALYEFGTPDPAKMEQINVGGTTNVLEIAAERGIAAVHCSSIAALGPTGPVPADESHWDTEPCRIPYDQTKRDAHVVARRLAAAGAPVRIAMPGGIYGPDDPSILGTLHRAVVRGWLPIGPPRDLRMSVVHVDDCAAGLDLVAQKGQVGGEYVLVSDAITFREWMSTLLRVAGRPQRIVYLPNWLAPLAQRAVKPLAHLGRPGRLLHDGVQMAANVHWAFTGEKARRELGWQPRSLEAGFSELAAWYKVN
jgi:dihydroflavonol-4-reductase